ncbi:zinc finger, C2H2 type, partial [Opisthorchis viverrini]
MRFRFQGVAHDQWTTVMTKNTSGKYSNFVDAEHPNLNVLGGRLRDKATRSSQPEKYGKPKTPRENNCDICGKSFLRLSDRRRHATVHTGSKNYKCEFCNKSFAQHTSLKGHKTVAHSSEQASGVDQVKICEICGKRAATSWDLAGHMLMHSKERPFLCYLCGRLFGILNIFHRHRRINSVPVEIGACQQKTEEHSIGVIQYTEASKVLTTVCLSLGYVISECLLLCTNQRNCTGNYPPQKHSLITEMVLIPTADLITQSTKEARPPLSKILAQVQHNSQNGTGQTNIHLPVGQNTNTPLVTNMYRREAQPYTCNLCGKSFLAAAHLRRHAGVNTKSKNYLCDCCTKQFKYESSLKIHKQVAHPDKETEDSVAKHVCEICGRRSSCRNPYARSHKRKGIRLSYMWTAIQPIEQPQRAP